MRVRHLAHRARIGNGRDTHFSLTSGAVGASPERWPADSITPRTQVRAMIVLSAHPNCPCTEATTAELAQWMDLQGDRPETVVLAVLPDGANSDWDLKRMAELTVAIAGARMVADRGGVESLRHGAMTSGHLTYYDGSGLRRYQGGVTVPS